MKIGNLGVYGVIYKITNLINGKVYIGQTINKRGFNGRYSYKGKPIEKVYKFHNDAKSKNKVYNEHLYNSIKKYGFDSFVVNEFYDFAFSKEELDVKEKCYIQYYQSYKVNYGYNIERGGNDSILSEQTKKKLSKIQLNKDNDNIKSILQFDTDGILIRKWERGANQIKRESEFDDSPIRNCCKGIRKSAYGFIWLYECDYNEDLLENKINNKHEREIIQKDLTGKIINVYKNILDVESCTGISRPTIGSMLKGNKSRKYLNFTFEYKQVKLT